MTCYSPAKAYLLDDGGKQKMHFSAHGDISVRCRRCVGCRLDYASEWSFRCDHENLCHLDSSFLTLTYSNDNLPNELKKSHIRNFFKCLRKKISPVKIRYYGCGEYGGKTYRPHYHILLFGYDFPDKTFEKKTGCGSILYRSRELEKTWKYGFSWIGQITTASANYTARYILKKQYDENAIYELKPGNLRPTLYKNIHGLKVQPEYTFMSTDGGIGYPWLRRYVDDVYSVGSDCLVKRQGNYLVSPPRYYDKKVQSGEFGEEKAEWLKIIRKKQLDEMIERGDLYTRDELLVKQKIKKQCVNNYLYRELESEVNYV